MRVTDKTAQGWAERSSKWGQQGMVWLAATHVMVLTDSRLHVQPADGRRWGQNMQPECMGQMPSWLLTHAHDSHCHVTAVLV